MATYVMASYRPDERESADPSIVRTNSDLRIDLAEYKASLLQRWPGIRIDASKYLPLRWFIPVTKEGALVIGGIEGDRQTVFLDAPLDEFFFWHRSIVPAQYPLFLFHEGSWDTLEVKPDTGLAEIKRFTGAPSS